MTPALIIRMFLFLVTIFQVFLMELKNTHKTKQEAILFAKESEIS